MASHCSVPQMSSRTVVGRGTSRFAHSRKAFSVGAKVSFSRQRIGKAVMAVQERHKDVQTQGAWFQPQATAVGSTVLGALLSGMLLGGPVLAADTAKVGTCLLSKCQTALAQCVGDVKCLEDLVCLQNCNGRPDETACQIRCGDLYEDKAVQTFNACAVSEEKCVPQRVDNGLYPVPPDCSLDKSFDLNMFTGRWYITAGLNPLFDVFPCQEHFFGVPEPGNLYGKINWRIVKNDNDFIERSTVQTFVQDPENPAKLYNHDNEYLHYEDDWYILASKPDEYIFIYYLGNNDAWKGYGGATVYSRAASLPEEYIPELREAADRAGLNWDNFILTDNTCGPHPPPKSVVEEIEKDVEKVEELAVKKLVEAEKQVEKLAGKGVKGLDFNIESDLKSFGKGFTVLEKNLVETLTEEEKVVANEVKKELLAAEKFLEGIERQYKTPAFSFPFDFKFPWWN